VSFTRLWAFLAIGLPVLAAVIAPFPSVDLTYHLRAGGEILDTGRIPSVDTYTFTVAGQPWLDQQWLAELVMAAAYRLGSWTGLVVLRVALVGIAFGLLFDLCRRRARSIRIAAWLALAAFVCAAITLGLRPQLFGIAAFAAVVWLVFRRHDVPTAVWLVLPLVALWANVHGSFVLGPAVVALAVVEDLLERRREWVRTSALLLGAVLATLVNPFGLSVWRYAVGISTNSVITQRITEWQRTSPLTPEGALFYGSLVLVGIALVAIARRQRRIPLTDPVWLVPFAVLGIWAVRGLAWWPFVAAAIVSRAMWRESPVGEPKLARPEPAGIRRINAGIVVALSAIAAMALPIWRPLDRGLGTPVLVVSAAPSGITGALRDIAKPGDRLLAPQPWGSWFEFALPDVPVAVDSRIELFPADVWDAIDRVEAGDPGWEQILDEWRVTFVIAAPNQDALVDRLVAARWEIVRADEDGRLLARP